MIVINPKYSSSFLTVHVAEWLAYFPLNSYITGSRRDGRRFIFQCACHSVVWMVTQWWLKCDWNPPFLSPFSRLSVTIQSTERWDFILWNTYVHNFIIFFFIFPKIRNRQSCCRRDFVRLDIRQSSQVTNQVHHSLLQNYKLEYCRPILEKKETNYSSYNYCFTWGYQELFMWNLF